MLCVSQDFPDVLKSFAKLGTYAGSTQGIVTDAKAFVDIVDFHGGVSNTDSTNAEHHGLLLVAHHLLHVVLEIH